MEALFRVLLGAGVLIGLSSAGFKSQCERENFLGFTEYFQCPGDGDSPDEIFCCGSDYNKYCCSLGIDEEHIEEFLEKLPTIIGVVIAVVLGIIVACIVCCCCCPFCLLYKRRNRGTVHNPNPEVAVPLQAQPQQFAAPPQAAPYPGQPGGYPVQPSYPPQAGYPTQPYPPAPYPTEQPPMYTEKQPAYNPTY